MWSAILKRFSEWLTINYYATCPGKTKYLQKWTRLQQKVKLLFEANWLNPR